MEYILRMEDDYGCSHSISFGDELPDQPCVHDEIENWVKDGEWGDDGTEISVKWNLIRDREEVDSDSHTVIIEPNHFVLINNACGYDCSSCGNDPDDHDWTSDGEGGASS